MSYDIENRFASKASWYTPAESNAHYKARYAREGITVHWWGDGSGADNHDNIVNYFFSQGLIGAKSVNFVVSDKKITLMVDPDNVAWCSQGGNPTTISIEFQPTLSDEGYRRGGWLISTLEKRYGHRMSLYPHSHWSPTSCPGTINIDRLRAEANNFIAGTGEGESMKVTPNHLKYLYLGIYAQNKSDAELAADSWVGQDYATCAQALLDYANKNNFAYWQVAPAMRAQIVKLTAANAEAVSQLQNLQTQASSDVAASDSFLRRLGQFLKRFF